jgi:hypothetical protein
MSTGVLNNKTKRYRYAIAMWDGIPPFLAIGFLDMGGLRISEIVWIKSISSSYAEEKKN